MTTQEIMTELQAHGDEKIKAILLKHGVREPFFGVKIEFLKTIQKKVKKDHRLALELYATGNADAMYLAGLIADDSKMTRKDLQTWVCQAVSHTISGYTVPWVASGNPLGYELAMEWIDAKEEYVAVAGWSTLAAIVSMKPDAELDLAALQALLKRIAKTIHSSQNRVRYNMNGFIIAVGAYVTPLTKEAIATANAIGTVYVDMGDTSCKVPDAVAYIAKIETRGALGKKKKTVKC